MRVRDWPIEKKFLVGTLGITLAATTLISAFLITTELRVVRENRLTNTKAFVDMIATNAAAALLYDDPEVALEILASASAEPSTRGAALYDAEGNLYAWFPTNLPPSTFPLHPLGTRPHFTRENLDLFAEVVKNGRKVGSTFLRVDLSPMRQRFRVYVLTVVSISITSIGLVLLLSRLLHRWIARPLVSLSKTANTIAVHGDYNIRVEKEAQDEVGELVDAFNHMVQEVQFAHKKLRGHAADLESEVAERTAKLRETVLELEAFSYSVSHDMRAPLRAMQGYAQFILEDSSQQLSPESANYLRRIMRASNRLDALIQDILTYSRVARGELEAATLDLDKITSDLLAEYPQFTSSALDLAFSRPLGSVRAHAAALSQVFSNLIGNAIKFVRPSCRPVVRVWSEQRDGRRRVFVQDNGLGIAEKDLERIFRIFERVHDNSAYEGTGIGLSIVRKAVEKMGGTVGVTSTLGVGSTFWFELEDGETKPVDGSGV